MQKRNMYCTDFVLNDNPSVFCCAKSTSLEGELTEGQERLVWAIHKGGRECLTVCVGDGGHNIPPDYFNFLIS